MEAWMMNMDRKCDYIMNKFTTLEPIMPKIDKKNSIEFIFCLNDLKNFIQQRSDRLSEIRYCLGVPFFAFCRSFYKKSSDLFIEIYLSSRNGSISDWSVRLNCEFRIKSKFTNIKDVVYFFTKRFDKTNPTHGYPEFINYNEIKNYLENDTLSIKLTLRPVLD